MRWLIYKVHLASQINLLWEMLLMSTHSIYLYEVKRKKSVFWYEIKNGISRASD